MAFDDPTTPDEARATWREWCSTRRTRPGVPDEGAAVLDLLLASEVGPASAWKLLLRAAEDKEWSAEKLVDLKREVFQARADGKRGADVERIVRRKLGDPEEPPPAPPKPPPEKPGARWFASGAGPVPEKRWAGGDIEQASAFAGTGLGALVWRIPEGGAVADRYVVYLLSDAMRFWSSSANELFTGKTDWFVAGCVVVPAPGQKDFAVIDRNDPVQWKAAFIFADKDGKRTLLAPDVVRWEALADQATPAGAVEAPKGYRP